MVVYNNILAGASGQTSGAAAAYQIDRSIRINDDDTAYLNRTPSSASNRKTWTWSAWVKRSKLSAEANFFSVGASSTDGAFRFNGDDTLKIRDGAGSELVTNAVFRDPSAWYHIVISADTTQSTASNRFRLYVNGVEQTYSSSSYATQNADGAFNNNVAHYIGRQVHNTSNLFDGYLTEIHFVDGTQLAASDFGEYDDNNVWQPKAFSGTYGTNGFKLDFSDNTSTTTIAEDSSGNNNDWTANNISVASGAGNDSLIDTPTNYTAASGNNGGNYATLNPLQAGSQCTLSNGNLDLVWSGSSGHAAGSTIAVSSGKWYVEFTVGAKRGLIGIIPSTYTGALNIWPGNSAYGSDSYGYYGDGGNLYNNSSNSAYGDSWTTNDVIGIALDLDAGNLVFYKNGSSQGTAATGLSGSYIFAIGFSDTGTGGDPGSFNFGQRPFAYTPPTGYVSLCTTNLPDPTIADGSTVMDVALYTGDGNSTQTISGLSFNPDFIWNKARSAGTHNRLFDVVRGFSKFVASDNTGAEDFVTDYGYVTATSGTGFTVGQGTHSGNIINTNGATFVNWCWDAGSSTVSNTDGSITSQVRANASAGFSIVSYTGNGGASATIGHGLNAAPEMIIVKNRDVADEGAVYHVGTDATSPQNYFLKLFAGANGTAQRSDTGAMWNDTSPTSSVFSVGTEDNVNASTEDYIAYCWAPVEGYSAFGTYTGNGDLDGPFVYTGFRPRFILHKTTAAETYGNWHIYDTARDPYNAVDNELYPNSDAQEGSIPSGDLDILSNGFKIRTDFSGGWNTSGTTYIYAAFAEHPFSLNGGLAR